LEGIEEGDEEELVLMVKVSWIELWAIETASPSLETEDVCWNFLELPEASLELLTALTAFKGSEEESIMGFGSGATNFPLSILYPLWVRQCSSYSLCFSGSEYLMRSGCPRQYPKKQKKRIYFILIGGGRLKPYYAFFFIGVFLYLSAAVTKGD
jgi:hypothetical protein